MKSTDTEKRQIPVEQSQESAELDTIDSVLEKISPDTPPEVVQLLVQSASFSGPLPPPVLMKQYEDILPGAAERIFKLAENEQEIRRSENSRILSNDTVRVWGSIGVSLALIVAGVICVVLGSPVVGAAIATSGTIAGIMGAILKRRSE